MHREVNRAVVGLGALLCAGCGAGVSLNPGGEPHADAPNDAGDAPPPFDTGAESRNDGAPDVPLTDGPTESTYTSDTREVIPPLFSEFGVPTPNTHPAGIALGPDGNVWFTETAGNKRVGRVTPTGVIQEFDVASSSGRICAGPDGHLWFSELSAGRIARMSILGNVNEFDLSGAIADGITAGPDGNIWFAEGIKIGRMTPLGQNFTEFSVPSSDGAAVIVSGSDGNLWVSDLRGRIYRVTPAGIITAVDTPTPGSGPIGIAWNSVTGRLWFTEGAVNQIGTLDPQRVDSDPTTAITEFPIATSGGDALGIAIAPDGTVWFTEFYSNRIGTMTADGVVTELVIPTPDSGPANIVADSAGNLWFTEQNANTIGRLSPAR